MENYLSSNIDNLHDLQAVLEDTASLLQTGATAMVQYPARFVGESM